MTEPSNVEVVAVSPTSFSVTWTCCTNNKSNYTIIYTHDPSIPKKNWQQRPSTCRDSFGTTISGVPTDAQYTVCVVSSKNFTTDQDNCANISLNKDSKAPADFQPSADVAPCNCVCRQSGEALIRPSCDVILDLARPISTLPPANHSECPCKVTSHGGRCPQGYLLQNAVCYDIDECSNGNGGCSHGCVNTPGSFYCACPYGLARDPLDPTSCVDPAHSFDRIAQLLSQYLHANAKNDPPAPGGAVAGQKVNYKAVIKGKDDRSITFEWSAVPMVVRRAFKWLF